jgi:hypothetical protein
MLSRGRRLIGVAKLARPLDNHLIYCLSLTPDPLFCLQLGPPLTTTNATIWLASNTGEMRVFGNGGQECDDI